MASAEKTLEFSDKECVNAARNVHATDGEIEIDDDAKVSRGADRGVYVQAWVWVSDATMNHIRNNGGK